MLGAPVSVDISFNFGVMSQVAWTRAGDLALTTSSIWWTQWQAEEKEDSLPSYVRTEKLLSSRKEVIRAFFCILNQSRGEKTSGIKNWKT